MSSSMFPTKSVAGRRRDTTRILTPSGKFATGRDSVSRCRSSARLRDGLGRRLAEMILVASGKLAHVPEAIFQGTGLHADRIREQQPLAYQPKSLQSQIAMQAHATILQDHVLQGSD